MVRIPTDREPTHPGEMLLQESLPPLGMTQRDLAITIHVPFRRINEVVRKRLGVPTSTALRLSSRLRKNRTCQFDVFVWLDGDGVLGDTVEDFGFGGRRSR